MRITPLTRFISASGFTNLADGVATVAWAWMATLLTRDALLISLLPVALRLPWFLFALPAGLAADRVDRKRLIQAMDVARALAFCVAAVAVIVALPLPPPEDGISSPGLYAILVFAALAVGTAEVYRDNAAQTMLPSLVPQERLERANGRLWSVELIGNELLGPALGAFLIAFAVWSPFALNAAAFGIAAFLLLGVEGQFRPPSRAERDWRAELSEGIAFLRGNRLLQALALITGGWNLLYMMTTVALVLHVQENLGLGAPAYGLILSAGAIGGVAGSLIAERVIESLGQGRTTQLTLTWSALTFIAIPLAPNGWVLAVIMAVFQASGLIWNTVTVSHRQRVTPNAILGRVNSLYRLLAWGMMPIGLVVAGAMINLSEVYVAREVAITLPFIGAAVGAMLLTLAGWRALGRGFAEVRT